MEETITNSTLTCLPNADNNYVNGNCMSDEEEIAWPCNASFGCFLRHSITWTIIYMIAYLVVFLIGLVGNLSVLWITYALRKQKSSSVAVSSNRIFYRFVANLALADLLVVIFCLPPTLIGNTFGRE